MTLHELGAHTSGRGGGFLLLSRRPSTSRLGALIGSERDRLPKSRDSKRGRGPVDVDRHPFDLGRLGDPASAGAGLSEGGGISATQSKRRRG
jgi:hypothetical protein